MPNRSGSWAQVVRQHVAKVGGAIRVRRGEIVQVGSQSDEYAGWWWCRASDGRSPRVFGAPL